MSDALDNRRLELAAIVESSSDAIISKSLDGIITTWNQGAELLFGYPASEATGRSILMLVPPDRLDEERLAVARVSRGERVETFVTMRLRKDGSLIPVSIAISPIRDAAGKVIGASKIARGAAANQNAEAALKAAEEHYQLLFESNPIPVFVYDQATLALVAVNEAAVRHYGYSRQEFLSKSLGDIALAEEVPAFLQRLTNLSSAAGNSGIWRHRRQNGKLTEMEITTHALDFGGRQAWLSLAKDVTERQSLEAQLRQSQKMESVGQLAGGVAHDFNNLLTVITGHTGLLMTMADLKPQAMESLREIAGAAKRAADLTRQLLTFSRKTVMQPQIVDLNEVVSNITKMLRRVLGEDISLEVSFTPSLPSVKADLGMLEQVLLNLAVNSRDAMPKGGQLKIRTTSVTTDDAYARQNPEASAGKYVVLGFADTGCGIPPENLQRIFEPFFTTKELDRGTGLGLATVYGIIKQHQGWIEVSSEVNRGANFQIYLPASFEESSAPAMPPGKQRVIGGTETVLVVEDEPPLLNLIQHILESYGYKVLQSSTGKAALKVWSENRSKIELLLTDMILPDGMAGPDLAKILLAAKPELKVIYTSGYGLDKLQREFTLASGSAFLQKPFHARKLAETVYDCLNGRRQRDG